MGALTEGLSSASGVRWNRLLFRVILEYRANSANNGAKNMYILRDEMAQVHGVECNRTKE